MSPAAKKLFPIGASATEEELKSNELHFIADLQAAMQRWYAEAGPGVDVVWYGISLVVKAADEVAARLGTEDEKDPICRLEALQAMREALNIKWPKTIATQRTKRERLLRRDSDPKLSRAYEAKTIILIAADFPAWHAEVGIWGFVRSLLQLVKVGERVFDETLEDASTPKEKVLFLVAFELRRRLGKVDDNLLGALELLGAEQAGRELVS
ncbi:MAG: hypothetical protein Q8S71_10905 [Hydrogenophaga sp.]|nr:hypothetical protein [Hydrogenophaga sp.]MDP3324041.1 hypothetical protein [Hydrogenophaga sp.]